MKTVFINIFLIFSLICAFPGCTKIGEDNPEYLQNQEKLVAVKHSIYGIDSIFFENDIIKDIRIYKKSNSELMLSEEYILERSCDQLKVSVLGERAETNIFTFSGQAISEIQCPEEKFKAEFHYRDVLIEYVLYKRGEYRDSLAFTYDRKMANISRMEWYNISSVPVLYFAADYAFDDKRNPYDKSIYWLAMNWKGPDNIVQYFNSSNILSIGSHKLSYGYNENDYPVYMEIAYYGRTTYAYQTW